MRRAAHLTLILVGVAILSGCVRMAVTRFSPGKGLPGTIVEIRGRGFDPDPFSNKVTIGGSPTRVINGTTRRLRSVALRNLASGPIVSQRGMRSATSARPFKRDGATTRATPLQDSDSKLVEGQGVAFDRRYDMQSTGLNQKVLIVLAKPNDINPEDLAPMGKTARQAIADLLNDPNGSVNQYFKEASYNNVSAAFTV